MLVVPIGRCFVSLPGLANNRVCRDLREHVVDFFGRESVSARDLGRPKNRTIPGTRTSTSTSTAATPKTPISRSRP